MTLEVLGETTAVADPGEGPFNDPAFGKTSTGSIWLLSSQERASFRHPQAQFPLAL
jgi:hypothetical protein